MLWPSSASSEQNFTNEEHAPLKNCLISYSTGSSRTNRINGDSRLQNKVPYTVHGTSAVLLDILLALLQGSAGKYNKSTALASREESRKEESISSLERVNIYASLQRRTGVQPPVAFWGHKACEDENRNRKIKLQRWSSARDHAFIHTQCYFSDI